MGIDFLNFEPTINVPTIIYPIAFGKTILSDRGRVDKFISLNMVDIMVEPNFSINS